jgi:hypothetical protein
MPVLTDLMLRGCHHARDVIGKPVVVCISLEPRNEDEEERKYNLMIGKKFGEKGFPVYSNLEAAIKALANLYRFNARISGE